MVVVDIIVSRHGQTDPNSKELLQGCVINDDLNKVGVQQAQQLAERLQDERIDWIITSPLLRTVHTAQIVAQYHANAEVTKDHQLRAMSWGILDGVSIKECEQIRATVRGEWNKGDLDAKVADGESANDCRARIIALFTDTLAVAARNNYKCVYMCTHGGIICVILASLVDKELVDMDKYRTTNCGYFHFQVDVDLEVLASKGVDGLVFKHICKDIRDHLKQIN